MALHATLYLPDKAPQPVSAESLVLPDPNTGLAGVPPVVPALLGCMHGLVDVLASGEDYVVYAIFDSEQDANPAAMLAVAELTGTDFDVTDEDELLRGPVLIISIN